MSLPLPLPPPSCHSNTFTGPEALRDFYNPDKCPPLPLVELPNALNPYRQYGVRVYAKLMTFLPAANVKSLPALNMLMEKGIHRDTASHIQTPPLSDHEDEEDEQEECRHGQCLPESKPKAIVEYSSGSTAISLGILSRIFGVDQAHTFLSNKTSAAKLSLLRFFGLELTLFGGPSQPLPTDQRGGIFAAQQAGMRKGFCNPDQYTNAANYEAHVRWTGPQLFSQLPHATLVCAGMGTSGTMTGTALFAKQHKPSTFCLGVCTAPGERVPGPRQEAMLAPVTFPFRTVVDEIVHVTSKDAYRVSMDLCRHGLLAGPSSGLALQGVWQHVQRRIDEGTLDAIRDSASDQVHCVFLCCDPPFQYVDEYFDKLGKDHFPPIHNDILIHSDKYRYDDAWELREEQAVDLLKSEKHVTVVDLRMESTKPLKALPIEHCHARIPLRLRAASHTCPFTDPILLDAQWKELESVVEKQTFSPESTYLFVCSTGGTSRIASSVFRNRTLKAFSLLGGLP